MTNYTKAEVVIKMIKKINLKTLFKRILIFFSISYVLALILSLALVNGMSSIIYESTAFGLVLEEYKLDFISNKAEYNSFDFDGIQVEHEEINLSSSQEFKFKTLFAISLVPLWKESYDNPFIMDGDEWIMTRAYSNEEKDITYGSNAYPVMYPFVLHAIKGLFA